MLTKLDQERLDKATQAASLLSADVRDLSRADNTLLADIAYTMLDDVVALHQRMQRIAVLGKELAEDFTEG